MSKQYLSNPFFIVSSGRSGTQMLAKLLATYPEVEMHHEYLCTHVQLLSVKYYMELISYEDVAKQLLQLQGAALRYCDRPLWGDSSNKLSWVIEILADIFPSAKFIHLVRDGRKVTSSFLHKLSKECYADNDTRVLENYVANPQLPEPPPEKKYWWCLPKRSSRQALLFKDYDQFQRICFHWGEVNRSILKQLKPLSPKRKLFFRLEDFVSQPTLQQELLTFLGLDSKSPVQEQLKRPHNVNIPQDFLLTEKQNEQLMEIAGDMMNYFGYDQMPEYRDNYHPK